MEYADAHLHMTDKMFSGTSDNARVMFSCTTTPEEWGKLKGIDDRRVTRFYGLHPWFHRDRNVSDLETILSSDEHACVGEIGLDSKHGNIAEQAPVFIEQLDICRRHDRLANVHMVGCENEMLKILRKHRTTCILHSFSGPESYIRPFAECGCYFSISPRLLSRSPTKIIRLLDAIPEDRILIETDAPNSGTSMEMHIDRLSDIVGIESDDLAGITLRNALSLKP